MEQDIISLNKVICDLDRSGNYFLDVFNTKGLAVGILRLKEGEVDAQLPHSVDEVYFVVEGNGFIEIEGKLKSVKSDELIFVPANTRHRFILGSKDLVIIYFFGS